MVSGEGGEIQFDIFVPTWTHFGPKSSPWSSWVTSTSILHDFNLIREQFWQSVFKEDKIQEKRYNEMSEKKAAGAPSDNSFHTEAGWHALVTI